MNDPKVINAFFAFQMKDKVNKNKKKKRKQPGLKI